MSPSTVSVITIFLNEERFLREAVESVLAQGWKDWEYLLVDDGSSDGSTEIARGYADLYPDRIHYLDHEGHANRGMSASRNLGLRKARGEFVGFLDGDDVWLPGKLERQVGLLRAHPTAAMVYGRTEFWHSWTGRAEDQGLDHHLELGLEPDRLVAPPDLVPLLLRNEDQLPGPSDVLFRRVALDEVGGFEDTFTGMFEDIVVLSKLAVRKPVYVADEPWFKYRQHGRSCVTKAIEDGSFLPARRKLLVWLEEYFRREGIADGSVWRALRRELRPFRHPRLHRILLTGQRIGWRVRGSLAWAIGGIRGLFEAGRSLAPTERKIDGDATIAPRTTDRKV